MRSSACLVAFLAAFAVRLAFVLPKGPDLMRPLEDQRLYLRMGRAVAQGRGLTLPPREYHPLEGGDWKREVPKHWVDPYDPGMGVAQEGKPTALIEPLYPLFVGAVDRLSTGNVPLVRVVQAALGGIAAASLCAVWAPVQARVGLIAGLLFAVFPHAVYYTGMVTTESLFIALQAIAVAAWAQWIVEPAPARAALFGAASGIAFLARAAMLPVAAVAVGVGSLACRRTLRSLPVAAAGFALAVSPWVVRNGRALGEYRLMPTKDGLNLWMQNHPEIQQLQLVRVGLPIPQAVRDRLRCRELEAFPAFADSVPEVVRNRVLASRARAYLACNPRYFATMCWLRLRWYLRFTGSTVRSTLVDFVSSSWFASLLFFAAVGTIRGWRRPVVAFSALSWLASAAMHALFHGGVRYRIPADSLLILAASYGLEAFLPRRVRAGD